MCLLGPSTRELVWERNLNDLLPNLLTFLMQDYFNGREHSNMW